MPRPRMKTPTHRKLWIFSWFLPVSFLVFCVGSFFTGISTEGPGRVFAFAIEYFALPARLLVVPFGEDTLASVIWMVALALIQYALVGIGLDILINRLIKRPGDSCKKCGYSLRGNTSGRCPECGKPVRTPSP